MPRLKLRTRRAESSKAIAQMREAIAAGYPWLHNSTDVSGYCDLTGLVTGHWYGFSDFVDEEDPDSKRALWLALRDDILAEHAKRRPGSRPAAWWKWDAPEPRRVIGRDCLDPEHDDDCDGKHAEDDGRLPAAEDPNLPDWAKGKMYFGAPSVYDGYCYELQHDYLKRLDLLTEHEKNLFAKFENIVFVHASPGEYGKCEACWNDAREIAKEIDLDFDAVVLRGETFWLPDDLVFECDHREKWNREGIFTFDHMA